MTLLAKSFGGTGLSLGELDEMPRRDREAILAGTILTLREQLTDLRHQLAESEGMLRDAMLSRNATIADAGAWTVKLSPRRAYTYDLEALSQLQAFLEPEQYERAVVEVHTVKPNKTQLNQLAKRGGEIAAIITAAVTESVAGYDLEVTR